MTHTPIILTGPPGCGKSYWIQKYAEHVRKQLFVCPCRKDRTLRDGRQKLHIWARRTEPAILWLEGADDLTPEAQAFLRRILETHTSEILFVLECRDPGRLQEPIRSRCVMRRLNQPSWNELEKYIHATNPNTNSIEIKAYLQPNEYSYRRVQQCITLQKDYPEIWNTMIEHSAKQQAVSKQLSDNDIIKYIKQGYNPDSLITSVLTNTDILKDYGKCIEISGSLWAFLGSALYKSQTTKYN